MESKQKWFFTKEQLENTPSRKYGFDADKELSYRQQAANFIQDMGQRLLVSQLCINTAIVYMHRFYVFHSFTLFHRNAIAVAALFLAAKVEEQPRRLEHIIKVAHICLNRSRLDTRSTLYLQQAHELVVNENLILQTLGFDVAIDHPHTHVVRCCHLVRASKDLARASYFLASNSLHLTTMCLQYKPTVVACFCIHLACKWSSWKIPQSSEGKEWYWYVDRSVTLEQLEHLTSEFLIIFDKCPTKLKHKIRSINSSQSTGENNAIYLKRRRVDSPTPSVEKSENCATEDTAQFGSDFTRIKPNHFGNNLPPNSSNHVHYDILGAPKASTSRENYCYKPSTSSSHSSNFYGNSVREKTSHQPLDSATMHSFEYMCTILDPEVSHKRDSTASNAKRFKFDGNGNDGKIDVSKQYDKGECSKKYIYTSYR